MNKPFLPGPDADLTALEQFAAVKLIVADLDGTLFPSKLSGKAQQLLIKLKRFRVELTLATGRAYAGVQRVLNELTDSAGRHLIRSTTPLILYNGAVTVEAGTGRLLNKTTISHVTLESILRITSYYSSEVFAYFCQNEAFDRENSHFLRERVYGWSSMKESSLDIYEFNGLPIEWQSRTKFSCEDEACAILVRASNAKVLAQLATGLGGLNGISLTRSGSIYLELRPFKCNKSIALKRIASNLHLNPHQILAIGDNDNDAEMLQWAGIGVAVNTASVDATNNADFVCDYGPFLGVIQVLHLIHSSHRYYKHLDQKDIIS